MIFWKKKEETQEVPAQEKASWLSRLTGGLAKSSEKLTQGIGDILTKRRLDEHALEELEDLLITSDIGPKTAAKIILSFRDGRFEKEISDVEIREALAAQIIPILKPVARDLQIEKPANGPFVILVCGVNGVGKTTTIGKIAHYLSTEQNLKIALAAGDTFRAAAVEQLEIWAQRTNALFLKKETGSDAAALAYEAYASAKEAGSDVLLIDTAGRLHNKDNLMAELQKIVRVLKKHDENIPHAVLLVLDATTGQNAHEQVRIFRDMVNVTGLVVTKLDGSARGGVVVSLADAFGLPVHLIGVGEGIEDLRPFSADEYAHALVGLV